VNTSSGKAMSDDMALVMANALRAKGYNATPLPTTPKEPADAVAGRLKASPAAKKILLVVREWRQDAYTRLILYYDATLMVLDQAGATVAQAVAKGDAALGGAFNMSSHAKATIPKASGEILARLLNDPQVVAALR
jgi:hypothetical protein